MIAKEFGTEILDNEEGTLTDCCMANARLPIGVAPTTSSSKPLPEGVVAIEQAYAMQALNYITSKMVEEHDTFIALMLYKGSFWVRISGQIYLDEEDLVKGVKVLRTLVGEVKEGRYMEK